MNQLNIEGPNCIFLTPILHVPALFRHLNSAGTRRCNSPLHQDERRCSGSPQPSALCPLQNCRGNNAHTHTQHACQYFTHYKYTFTACTERERKRGGTKERKKKIYAKRKKNRENTESGREKEGGSQNKRKKSKKRKKTAPRRSFSLSVCTSLLSLTAPSSSLSLPPLLANRPPNTLLSTTVNLPSTTATHPHSPAKQRRF